jgi:hypothetical protein
MTLDPRYRMAEATDFVDHEVADGRHAVNIELARGSRRTRAQLLQALSARLGKAHSSIAPAQVAAPESLGVATAFLSRAGLKRLAALVQQPAAAQDRLLERFEYAQFLEPPRIRAYPALAPAAGIELPAPPARASRKRGAGKPRPVRDLFAVIDYGCPFMHPLLCTTAGGRVSTRVRALWDQHPAKPSPRTRPLGFDYGCELSREQLDALARAAGGDDRRAYAALGYEPMQQRESHGAHSLGMLLDDGMRPHGGLHADEAGRALPYILFVQLPQALQVAPNRGVLGRCVIDALVWIEGHRKDDERVILSLGAGSTLGPHDGSSIVERALTAFTGWGPGPDQSAKADGTNTHRIYIAAGNGFEEDLHAEADLEADPAPSFIWRVPPGSELPASVEIWLPTGAKGAIADRQIELFAPDGQRVACVGVGEAAYWPAAGATAIASVVASDWRGEKCSLTTIRLAPTAAPGGGRALAPCGNWRIQLSGADAPRGVAHLYIGRVKQALGFPLRTVQSTFADAQGLGSLQGLATAAGVIRVGGLVGDAGEGGAGKADGSGRKPRAARYSSRGPSRPDSSGGVIPGPDLSVKSDDGTAVAGRRSIGNGRGETFRMNGTSVAAPLAARLDRATPRPPPGRAAKPVGKPDDARAAVGEVLSETSPRDPAGAYGARPSAA